MARVGEQPAREVLFAHTTRPPRPRARDRTVGTSVRRDLDDRQTPGGLSVRIERWRYAIPLWLRGLFRRRAVERDLDDEIRDHLERQTAAYVARGMSVDDARRAALVRFEIGRASCRERGQT